MNDLPTVLQATGGIGGWAIAFGVFGTILKIWPKLKSLQIEADGSLRHDLFAEIDRLRKDIVAAREEVAKERLMCEAKLAALELKHNTEMAGLRRHLKQILESVGRVAHPRTAIGIAIAKAYPASEDLTGDK